MDRLLNLGLKILNAHAEAVESQAPQSLEVRAIRDAGINFDSDFGVGREGESLARVAEKIFHLRGSKIGRRATAPMELNYGALFRNPSADVFNFALQRSEVGNCDAFVFLNGNVAGAKQAEAFAERKMHVERKRGAAALGARVI